VNVDPAGLERVRSTLAADGYGLELSEHEDRVVIQIRATPEACEDCLAPPAVLRSVLAGQLAVPAESIELRYP